MSLDSAITVIESVEFDVEVNVASHLGMACEIAKTHPDTRALALYCEQSDTRDKVFERVVELAKIDPGEWAHPGDIAMLTYMCVLLTIDHGIAVKAGRCILTAKNTTWAQKLAQKVVS